MKLVRRDALGIGAYLAAASAGGVLSLAGHAAGFAEDGAFHPRLLLVGDSEDGLGEATRAASRWSLELMRRTSAPARLAVQTVRPSSPKLLEEPMLVWQGNHAFEPLAPAAVRHLQKYLRMGGLLVVDDRSPKAGGFSDSVKRELQRVLPDSHPAVLPDNHVVFKSFYLLPGPAGRVEGPGALEAIVAGKAARVLFLRHDLLGALARSPDGQGWAYPAEPGGAPQREQAIRLAVNIAMYALCSDYKDDQVHAPFLMRRRQRGH